jgi:hypothetical protein
MSTYIDLPENYDDIDPNQAIPSVGDKRGKVVGAEQGEGRSAKFKFQITEGTDQGLYVFQNYDLDHPRGKQLFRNLMLALHIERDGLRMEIEQAIGKEVVLTLAHRQSNGTTFVNVVDHRPDF